MPKYRVYNKFQTGRKFLFGEVEAKNAKEATNIADKENRRWKRATKSEYTPRVVGVRRVGQKKKQRRRRPSGGFGFRI